MNRTKTASSGASSSFYVMANGQIESAVFDGGVDNVRFVRVLAFLLILAASFCVALVQNCCLFRLLYSNTFELLRFSLFVATCFTPVTKPI